VHLIAKNQSQYIGDDAVRLINNFLYSHKKTMDIASATLGIISSISSSDGFSRESCFSSSNSFSTAIMTTITH
jgi:hypothetical protein